MSPEVVAGDPQKIDVKRRCCYVPFGIERKDHTKGLSQSHRIHGTCVFTFYHTNQGIVGTNISYMDPMGMTINILPPLMYNI